MPVEDIVWGLHLKGLNDVVRGFQKIREEMTFFNQKQQATENVSKAMGKRFAQINEEMMGIGKQFKTHFQKNVVLPHLTAAQAVAQMGERIKDTARFSADVAQRYEAQGRAVQNMRKKFSHFRMELLGVMFGAQMVRNAMLGLLRPAMEAAGIFELISAMLLGLFLPVVMEMVGPLIDVVNWFMALPEPVKLFIGSIVAIVGAFAMFLATGAAWRLFMDSLMADFAKMGGKGGIMDMLTERFKDFSKVAAIGVSVYFALEALDEWKKGNYLQAIVDAIISGSSLLYALGKISGKTAIMLGVGAYFAAESLKDWKAGQYLQAIGDALIAVSGGLMMWNPVAGGVALVIGVGLKFLGWERIKAGLTGERFREKFGEYSPANNLKMIDEAAGSKATGGYIPHTGLYKLHAGETVQQAGSSSFSPTINVNASSNVDIEMLKTQLSRQWADDLARLSR